MTYIQRYFKEAGQILNTIDQGQVERMIQVLLEVRSKGGRLFFFRRRRLCGKLFACGQ